MIPVLAVVSHYGSRSAEVLQHSVEIALQRVFGDYTNPAEKAAGYFSLIQRLDYRQNPANDVLRLVQMLEDIEGPQVQVRAILSPEECGCADHVFEDGYICCWKCGREIPTRADLYRQRLEGQGYDVDFQTIEDPRRYSAYAIVKGLCVATSPFCASAEEALKGLAGELGVVLPS